MSKVQKLNLLTLARATGLSKATVSRALRNDPRQSAVTRERVQGLAQRLGYRAHPMVTALMTQIRTTRRKRFRGLIGILDTWPERRGWRTNPMVPPFLEGVRAQATQLGYSVDEFWLHQSGMTSERMHKVLCSRGALGLIAIPFPFDRVHHTLELDVRGFAVATMGYSLKTPDLHRACINHYASVALALDEMRRRGYRRIKFVMLERLAYRARRNCFP